MNAIGFLSVIYDSYILKKASPEENTALNYIKKASKK
jgi:hypothetical protein